MYKWLIGGCAIGFGLGLILTSIIFEMTLSPFDSPITIDYTKWDWRTQTNTWKLIGFMWILSGTIALYILHRTQEKPKTKSHPNQPSQP